MPSSSGLLRARGGRSILALTPEQRAAVESDAPRLVVSAGAGAGKTALLVARILRHVLRDGVPLEAVTAITFTRKSASELRSRVVAGFESACRPDLARLAQTVSIGTVDSWIRDLLRTRAVFVGIPPDFLDLGEEYGARLWSEAARHVLREVPTMGPEVRDVVSRLDRDYDKKRSQWGHQDLYARAETALIDATQRLRRGVSAPEDLAAIYATPRKLAEHATMAAQASRQGRTGPAHRPARDEGIDPDGDASREWALGRLCLAVWARFDALCADAGALDGDGVSRACLDLLRASPEIAESLRARNRVVLVDEAQDLSPVQHAILEALNPPTLVLVGDGRQSIYRFRDAEVELFLEAKRRMANVELSINHRIDHPAIAELVDATFLPLWGLDYTPIALRDTVTFPDDGGPAITTLPLRGVDPGTQVARLIERWRAEDPEATIGVLSQFRPDLRKVSRALDRLGVTHRFEPGNRDLYSQLEVRDMANALCAAHDETDLGALMAVLVGPAATLSLDSAIRLAALKDFSALAGESAGLPDAEMEKLRRFWEAFTPIRRLARRRSARETLGDFLDRTEYLRVAASRERRDVVLPNLRRIQALAAERPELRAGDFGELLREMRRIRMELTRGEESPRTGTERVDLMTIHGCKGLEFDRVILLSASPTPLMNDVVLVERQSGIVARYEASTRSPAHAHALHERRVREDAEMARLLYVALTRARKRLVVATGNIRKRSPHYDALRAAMTRLGIRDEAPPAESPTEETV